MGLSWIELSESLSPKRLHLILLPTEACNFRCVYCYESFRMKRMHPGIVAGVNRLLERRMPSLGHLLLSWFGGEPLLARDIVEDVMDHVRHLRRSHPSVAMTSDMTTNASLLDRPTLESLTERGVTDYQITLDGPRWSHDRKRVRPGGQPTFDLIWGHLLAALESPSAFRIQVRLHVDRENASAIPEFLEEYQESFGGDPRFELFLRGLSRLGGANDASLSILEGAQGATTIESLRRLAAARGIRQANVQQEDSICYAARGNSFVIRADGTVNKCTVALEHPRNRVGNLHPDGTLRLQADRVVPWMRGVKTADRAALACPMRGLADDQQRWSAPRVGRSLPAMALEGGSS